MGFWIIVVLMVAAGLFLILPSLLTKKNTSADDNRKQNVVIAKERMAELEAELKEGTLSQEMYQQTLEELEKSLLADVAEADTRTAKSFSTSGRWVSILLLIAVPLASVSLYSVLGSPQYLEVKGPGQHPVNKTATAPAEKMPTMEEMITGLQKKAAENPSDPNAWYLLGRLYAATEQYAESVSAYEKLVEVSDRQPTALVVLADSLAMTQGGSLLGRPIELIMEALEKEPAHTTALWMAGQAAADKKQYLKAVDYWQQAAQGLKDNQEMLAELNTMIDEAVTLAKMAGLEVADVKLPEPIPVVAISIEVMLDPALQSQIQENDVLFVFARTATGPPMPLAAIKRQASELPLDVVLDDSTVLRPDSSLSQYEQLKITARISKSGQPVAQSGDLESKVQLIRPKENPQVRILIDKVLP